MLHLPSSKYLAEQLGPSLSPLNLAILPYILTFSFARLKDALIAEDAFVRLFDLVHCWA